MNRPASTYKRTTSGLVVAMVITLIALAGFVAFRSASRDNDDVAVQPVDYVEVARGARMGGQLAVYAPTKLPAKWKSTSARYARGAEPMWHLGVVTADEEYIGVEESLEPVNAMVKKYVDKAATRDGNATVAGHPWQVWRDKGGDYALVRSFASPKKGKQTLLIVGSAKPSQIRSFVETLRAPTK